MYAADVKALLGEVAKLQLRVKELSEENRELRDIHVCMHMR